jgi:hypothetical protein
MSNLVDLMTLAAPKQMTMLRGCVGALAPAALA